MATKLELLLEKEAQLKAQIQLAKAAERTLEKKHDTRRKILIGAAVMARVQNGHWPKDDLLIMMDGFLTRPNERELFGLDTADEADETREEVLTAGKTGGGEGKNQPSAEQAAKKPAVTTGAKKPLGKPAKTLPETPVDLDNEFNL